MWKVASMMMAKYIYLKITLFCIVSFLILNKINKEVAMSPDHVYPHILRKFLQPIENGVFRKMQVIPFQGQRKSRYVYQSTIMYRYTFYREKNPLESIHVYV